MSRERPPALLPGVALTHGGVPWREAARALVDLLRRHLEKIAAGATVSVVVFTAASHVTRRTKAQGATVT